LFFKRVPQGFVLEENFRNEGCLVWGRIGGVRKRAFVQDFLLFCLGFRVGFLFFFILEGGCGATHDFSLGWGGRGVQFWILDGGEGGFVSRVTPSYHRLFLRQSLSFVAFFSDSKRAFKMLWQPLLKRQMSKPKGLRDSSKDDSSYSDKNE
jgi:hypothetical protein